LHT
jgi:hypothetical protein